MSAEQGSTFGRRLQRWCWFGVACFSFLAILAVFHAWILTAAADAWVVDDPLEKADAAVVLGGGVQYRTFEAARLYHAGVVPRGLVQSPQFSPTDALGLTVPEKELARQVLLKQGVPESAITMIGKDVKSTYEESVAVRDWVVKNHARRVIIPTDIFHTRRCRWLFHRILAGTGAEARIKAVPLNSYCTSNWWQSEEGLIMFQNEVIKHGLYWVKY